MQDKVKLNEKELLNVAGGSDNKNSDTSKFECGNLSKKECKNHPDCQWVDSAKQNEHCISSKPEGGW